MELFTYGTLMDPAVWLHAAGRPCGCEPASLRGYEARALRGVHFPGLIEMPGAVTPGLLYRGVDAVMMARLDAYEDDFYQRIEVPVQTADGGSTRAWVYLMAPNQREHVLPAVWRPPAE